MYEEEARCRVADEHPLAYGHLRTGIETGPVSHAELFRSRNSSRDEGDFFADAADYLCASLHFVDVRRIQHNAIDASFENLDHKPGLFATADLHHDILASARQEVLNGNNRPIEHPKHEYLVARNGRSPVFILLSRDIHELDIDSGPNIPVLCDSLDLAKVPDFLTVTVRQNDRLGSALQGGNGSFLAIRHNVDPKSFHLCIPKFK